ncbi:MAG: HlyD family secretion protein, partial [Rhizobacter sp.]|nr:HlyD family secretion protein [Rhizobacter sp.]
QSRLAALDQQIEQMRSEQRQMAAEAELQGQRLRLALQAQARIESLRGDNFVSSAQVQAKAEEVLAIRAQLLNIERQRTVHTREIGNLQARRRELPMQGQSAQGEIERDLATLSQQMAENEAGRRIVLRAPQDGVITGVLSALGQSVGDGALLASLLPAQAKLEAHLFAPSSAVGFLRADQPVLLRYEAFPYQKFGHQRGTVLQVSRSPLPAGDVVGLALPATEARSAEPRYRITVALERQTVVAKSEAYPLAPGMQLDADVQLDRRRLIEWLFEPLLGMAGRL